jgi:hypothetical protein
MNLGERNTSTEGGMQNDPDTWPRALKKTWPTTSSSDTETRNLSENGSELNPQGTE